MLIQPLCFEYALFILSDFLLLVVPIQLDSVSSSAPVKFSPSSTAHVYSVTSNAKKATFQSFAHAGLSCNVTTNGVASQYFSSCNDAGTIINVPNNITVAVFATYDDNPTATFYSFYYKYVPESDSGKVIFFLASGLVIACSTMFLVLIIASCQNFLAGGLLAAAIVIVSLSMCYFAKKRNSRRNRTNFFSSQGIPLRNRTVEDEQLIDF